jgi:hypothetical protein
MRLSLFCAPVALLIPSLAHAATCEDSFTKTGSIISGQKFGASVTVPDLTPASAIGQLRGIVVTKNYDVMAAEPEDGSMLIEQPQTGKARAFPITITASPDGTVRMDAKLPVGMTANADSAKNELCGMLSQLKSGRAGKAAAAAGMTATGTKAPLALDSLSLSHQISKDTQRNAAAAQIRYKGKSFIIDGTVKFVDKDGDTYVVSYDIPEPFNEALRLPNTAPFKTDIFCRLARGQAAFALQLKPGKGIKLSGDYMDFDPNRHVLVLQNCRSMK